MKKLVYIFLMIVFGYAQAQDDKQPVSVTSSKDTTSVNRQLQKESDMKTMDAVKTQDHEKPVPKKPKNAAKNKDTTKVKKRAQH
jgi:alpha-L-arabinofuranosidase